MVKDTAIYGLSSIIGRFLNWCLVPLYTYMFVPAEYGIVSYLYNAVAVVLIIITYGMETGFFRFANHERYSNPDEVYSTSLVSLGFTSTMFFAAVMIFLSPISDLLMCAGHKSYVWTLALAVAIDAYTSLPFAYLRYKKRPLRFATIKLINIGLNIGLNLFFLLLCPKIMNVAPWLIDWFYAPDYGIGYIFTANLIASIATLLLLLPDTVNVPLLFNGRLLREMLRYSWPLLVLGVAGIMNQTISTLLFPDLFDDKAEAMRQVGIYSANYKIAIVMVMFIQAFRFAYEPFIFAQNRESGDSKLQAYRDAMKYFIIFALFIFLGVMFYLDIIKYFIDKNYFSGLKVVPVLMMAELFFAWAAFASYGTMMLASYFIGRSKYPIGYDIKGIFSYFVIAIVLYVTASLVKIEPEWARLLFRTVLLAGYVYIVCRRESINPLAILRRNRPVKTPTNK